MLLFLLLVKYASFSDRDSNKVTETKFDEEPHILIAGKENISLYNSNTHELQILVKHEHKIDAIDYHLGRKEGFFISYYGLWRYNFKITLV